jgi:hypothetical protein
MYRVSQHAAKRLEILYFDGYGWFLKRRKNKRKGNGQGSTPKKNFKNILK